MNDIPLDLTGLPANLLYSPKELEKWLDDTSVPLSDDDIKAMSSYLKFSESKYADIAFISSSDRGTLVSSSHFSSSVGS